jgi:flagellar basal body-associated protein FliL
VGVFRTSTKTQTDPTMSLSQAKIIIICVLTIGLIIPLILYAWWLWKLASRASSASHEQHLGM